MRTTSKYTFFWNGPFSNWYPSKFKIDEIEFKNVEQYMMYMKAVVFDDKYNAKLILDSSNPAVIKALGRQVQGYKDDVWSAIRFDIVLEGCYAKFTQNPELKQTLLDTGNTKLVEASPYDKIWGIGLGENASGVEDEKNWKGLNLLGQVLNQVKKEIRNET